MASVSWTMGDHSGQILDGPQHLGKSQSLPGTSWSSLSWAQRGAESLNDTLLLQKHVTQTQMKASNTGA